MRPQACEIGSDQLIILRDLDAVININAMIIFHESALDKSLLFMTGVGTHSAGLESDDRAIVERLFLDGDLLVSVAAAFHESPCNKYVIYPMGYLNRFPMP